MKAHKNLVWFEMLDELFNTYINHLNFLNTLGIDTEELVPLENLLALKERIKNERALRYSSFKFK